MKNKNVPTTIGNMANDVHMRCYLTLSNLKNTKPIAIEIPSITDKLAYRIQFY
jgi:hypothetical protein